MTENTGLEELKSTIDSAIEMYHEFCELKSENDPLRPKYSEPDYISALLGAKERLSQSVWHDIDPEDESTWPSKDDDILIYSCLGHFFIGYYDVECDEWFHSNDVRLNIRSSKVTKWAYIDDILKLG